MIDLRGAIPVMLTITTGKFSDVGMLDSVTLPKGSTAVLDRGYVDFARLCGLVFLRNRMDLPGLTNAAVYKQRCQVELFFQRLRRNLNIKHFLGNSLNAVKSQVWIAVSTQLMALIAHKDFEANISLRNILYVVEVNMFEKITMAQMVSNAIKGDDFTHMQA